MPNQQAIDALYKNFQPRDISPATTPYTPSQPQQLGSGPSLDNLQPQPYPGYSRTTFWNSPERIRRYVDAASTVPEDAQMPDWLAKNLPVLQEATRYYEEKYPGKSWWEWDALAEDDPMRDALSRLAPPPTYAMTEEEQSQKWYDYDYATQDAPDYTPEATVLEDRVNGYTREAWDALPAEQKFLVNVLPQFQNVMLIGQGALMGAQMGGVKGAVAGGVFSAIFGKQMQAEQQAAAEAAARGETIATPITDAFMALDIPRELLERTLGVLYQGYSEGFAATKESGLQAGSDAVADVLNNLPQAWQAAHEFYNLVGAGTQTDEAGNQVFTYQGVDYTRQGKAQGEVRKIVYGTEGAWDLGNTPDYVRQELASMRRALLEGTATPEQLYADLEGRYGVGAQAREIVSGFLLDPLNVAPDVARGVTSAAAKAAGNMPLARAMEGNKTIVGGVQEYGATLRQLTPAEASHYGAVSRFVAGLDKTGNLKDYAEPGADVGFLRSKLNYLIGLTPKARATEVVNNAAEALKLVLGEDGITAEQAYKTAVALTSPKNAPIDGMNAVESVNLPRIFDSAEAVPYMAALKSQNGVVKSLWDKHNIAKPQATLIQRMAQALNRSNVEMLDELKNATPEQADLIVRQFKDRLAEMGKTDPAAAAVLDGINKDRAFNGATVKKWAETFRKTDGPAFNDETFKAQLIVALEEGIERWTVDWFGVKPEHWFFRTADVLKKAQSYLLLGLNPSYLMNNAINNIVTMAWDGSLGMYTAAARKSIINELGVSPSRFDAGATAADIGDVREGTLGNQGDVLRKATQVGGNLQAISDFLDKGKKVQWASTLSQKAERWSSENAMTKAMLQYWLRRWKPGDGFDKVPQGLRVILEQQQPGIVAKIENAIAGSRNRAQAEKAVLKELGKRRLTDVLTADERGILANFPDLLENINRGLDKAKTPQERQRVFADARARVEKQVQDDITRNVRKISEEAANRVKTEGVQAVLDMAYQIAGTRADMHYKHRARLDDLFDSVRDKTGYERRMILENGLRAEDRLWNAHQNVEGARWIGMVKGLGADDPQVVTVERMLLDQHIIWDVYYKEKSKLINAFLDTDYPTREESSLAWAALNEKLDDMYADALEGEAGAQRVINSILADLGEAQFKGSRQQFVDWTEAVQHQHEQIGEAVRYFRTGKGKPDADVKALIDQVRKGEQPVDQIGDRAIRDVLWKEFNEKVYGTLVRRQLDAVNGGSAKVLGAPPGYAAAIQENIANVPPAAAQPVKMPLMVTQNMKRQLADLGYTPADIKQMKPQEAWDIINGQVAKVVEQAAEKPVEPAPEQPAEAPVQEAAPEPQPEPAPVPATTGTKQPWEMTRDEFYDAYERGEIKDVWWFEARKDIPDVPQDVRRVNVSLMRGDKTGNARMKLLDAVTEARSKFAYALYTAIDGERYSNIMNAESPEFKAYEAYLDAIDAFAKKGSESAQEWAKSAKKKLSDLAFKIVEARRYDRIATDPHAHVIRQAQSRGKPVPADVLAEYPDLVAPKPEPVPEKPPSATQERKRTAIREQVHGIAPDITADRHIVNTVKKYTGYAVESIDDITPDMVQAALARRSIEKHAEGGDWTEFDRRLVQSRAAQMEENVGRMELAAPKEYTREAWSRDLYDMLPEQAESLIAVTDAIADYWARENGKTRDEWYNKFLLERGGSEMGGDALGQGVKGSTRWMDNGTAVIHAFESADVSTMVHEVAHVWMEQLGEADRGIVARWLKQDGKSIDEVAGKEMFARGFERYLADGQAPTPKLAKVFANFKSWMLDIYKAITGSDIDVKLNDDIRALFDRWMLANDDAPVKVNDDYYTIRVSLDGSWATFVFEPQAKPFTVPGFEDQDFFIIKAGKEYRVSDGKSGRLLATGKSVKDVTEKITRASKDIPSYLQLQSRRNLSPRYSFQADAAEPKFAPEPPAPSVWDRPRNRQQGFFESGEDTPLFSGTPQTVREQTFNPPDVGGQDALFNMRDQLPTIEGKKVAPLRSSADITDAEFKTITEAAKDWKYLVYQSGKMTTKSALEDWLTGRFGIDRDLGHTIANRLSETFNPNRWTENRPEPKLSNYPELSDKPGQLFQTSRDTTATGADPNQTYNLRFKIVDLDDLVTSHTDTLGENPAFPKELQPRQRGRFAGREQVDRIARELNPDALLTDTKTLDRGPMIVGPDNIVESGNGRTISLRRAATDYPEKYAAYVDALRSRLDEYGLTPADLEGIEQPVLVRERVTEVDRAAFAAEANQAGIMRMSEYEQSLQDAGRVSDQMLSVLEVSENQTIEQALQSTANAGVIRSFVDALPENERATVMDAGGELSQAGLRRVREAIFAKAYQGEAGQRLLRLFSESIDPVVSNVKNAMYAALGLTTKAEGMIANGVRDPALSITDDIAKAVDVYARLKQQGASVPDYLKQDNLFENELDPFQMKLLQYLHENGRKPKAVRELLRGYAQAVIDQPDVNQGALFEMQPVSKGEILDGVTSKIRPDDEPGFAAAEEAAGRPAAQAAPVPAGRGELAGSPQEAQAPTQAVEPAPAIGAPLGTLDSLHQPPVEEAAIESYMRDIMPLLDKAERLAGEPDTFIDVPDSLKPAVRAYLGKVYNQMTDTKMGMMRYATARRDWSLLNYTRRHGMDNFVGAIMPYQFWYTRSVMNWAVRAITQPSILANYYRLTRSTTAATEREGYPTRLKEKMFIELPFLPEWMGEGIYVDPYRQIFPFVQMARPFVKRAEDANLVERKKQSYLDQMIENEEITQAQYDEAMTGTGKAYSEALAMAERDVDSDSLDAFDFATTLSSLSLPLEILRRVATGRKDKISQLPVTRFIQNVTTALGIGGDRGVNIEAPLRRAMGMPEIDNYEDTGINKLIADMVAEPGSTITPEEAMQAMIDRSGPVFDEANRRAGKLDLWNYVGASLAVDLFPEGEQLQRQMQVEYYNAVNAWKDGDENAINDFYDRYPEYEARRQAFKDPETQLRTFLISSVWRAYNELPDLHKRNARDQMGDAFTDAFLDKETRSYDSISTQTLATWAKTMNGNVPAKAGEVSPIPVEFAPEADATAYQEYLDAREKQYPGIGQTLSEFYDLSETEQAAFEQSHPEITSYNSWRAKYIGQHLDIVPYIVGQENELYGYPADLQKAVYAYRAERETLFPDINQQWDEYMALDKDGRKSYWNSHPDLQNYLDWQKVRAYENPDILPFVKSDESIQEMILPEKEGKIYEDDTLTEVYKRFSANVATQLMGNVYAGQSLGMGAMMELDRHYRESNYPGDFDEWLEAIKQGVKR